MMGICIYCIDEQTPYIWKKVKIGVTGSGYRMLWFSFIFVYFFSKPLDLENDSFRLVSHPSALMLVFVTLFDSHDVTPYNLNFVTFMHRKPFLHRDFIN